MAETLTLAANLSLPIEAVTRRMAILAMSGAGKSNTAVVMAEAMYSAGVPWVAVDPKGDWWGIRSSKNGKGAGLPIPIFGGLHGDIPLEPTAGKLIADLIVDQRLTCVLDVSEFEDRQKMWGFLADLGEQLLRRNRQALHLFLEEADEYLPQKAGERGNLFKCLGVWQRVVKRGRFRGMGSTQITQRSASLNKDTLYQAEALIAMRVSGKGDRDAIAGWVEHHQAAGEIVKSLPTLGDGEAWFTSPAWLKKTVRVQFDRRRTFDSGSTPVHLTGTTKPATLADVDLVSLTGRMAETIERAKADDPKELRKQLIDVRRQLDAALKNADVKKTSTSLQAKDVPVLTEADRALLKSLGEGYKEAVDALADRADLMLTSIAARAKVAIDEALASWVKDVDRRRADFFSQADKVRVQRILEKLDRIAVTPQNAKVEFRKTLSVSSDSKNTPNKTGGLVPKKNFAPSEGLTPAEQRIVDSVAWWNAAGIETPSRHQVAFVAKYTVNGHFNNLVGGLRTKGMVDYPAGGGVFLTEAGAVAARTVDERPTFEEFVQRVVSVLDPAPGRILQVVVKAGKDLARDELAQMTGYTVNGHFNNMVGSLRSLGVIQYPRQGGVRLGEMFEASFS